jgi:gamma-D-glutamyl-L-lysine dipeptidyl-peptidase
MTHRVAVAVATVWTSPEAPRDLDAAAVADEPDPAAWLAVLDAEGTAERRVGLHGRTLTQLSGGEPVQVLEEQAGWVRVVAPWQASSSHTSGYPGWVRRAHLAPTDEPVPAPAEASWSADDVLGTAREHLGLRYLWGGTSPWGLDCSGLVHVVYRRLGRLVSRDAFDQAAAPDLAPVPLDDVEPGDLYFFARPGERVYHVGFVARPVGADGERWMLHAPEGGNAAIEEAPMSAERRGRLVAAGRLSPR